MTTDSPTPFACSLEPNQYSQRLRQFEDLFAGLREQRREPARLFFQFDAAQVSEQQIRDLLRREQECCPFFTFVVEPMDTVIDVQAEVPDGAEEWLDGLEWLAAQGTASRT